jgi:hypothetical protein
VLPEQEAAFVAAWQELAAFFLALPVPPRWGTLLRSLEDPRLFYSFGPWPGVSAQLPRHTMCIEQPAVPIDHARSTMTNEALATYLNDHLAGSVVALQLLDHLQTDQVATAEASLLAGVQADIAADRQELEAVMAQLGITVSAPRKATGWLVEKLSEVKLHLDDAGDGALRRLEALETLSLGIAGKAALWQALAAAADQVPQLRALDYPRLGQRAAAQRDVVESLRLRAAREAFAPRS